MRVTNASPLDQISLKPFDDLNSSSVLSNHAMDLAVAASGGAVGGLSGWCAPAIMEAPGRAVLNQFKFLIRGADEMLAASREARSLPGAATGIVLGAAIAYGAYRWLTADSKAHQV